MNTRRQADFNVQTPDARAQRMGRAAIAALYDELALAPKPGLVSFVDSGSHSDMDAATFMRSLFALRHYFPRIAMLGAAGAPFESLQALGITAEARMLQATSGINTHRGAVFTLGLICAAAGSRQTLIAQWGDALQARRHRTSTSNGQRAARALGLRSVGEEAALGFPIVFDCAVPALAAARRQGLSDQAARLQTLFHIIAQLDDTNLAHRGGSAGLRFAQSQARDFLDAGGAARPDAITHAQSIHRAFIARRLSPGGAADVLAAASLIERLAA